jgi:hypothetical protein
MTLQQNGAKQASFGAKIPQKVDPTSLFVLLCREFIHKLLTLHGEGGGGRGTPIFSLPLSVPVGPERMALAFAVLIEAALSLVGNRLHRL